MKINWRKIWYGFAIGLSTILLLLSAAGILGVWVIERPLSNITSAVLESVINSAGAVRVLTSGIDQKLEQMQTITNDFSSGIDQLSQATTEGGLVIFMVLLPEEKEQSLREISDSVRATFATASDAFSTGQALYRSIDQLPFVSLPFPSQAQVEQAGQTLAKLQTSVDELQKNTAQIRAGVSGQIDKLGGITDQIAQQIGDSRDRLAKLDARLASLQAVAEQLKKSLQTAIILFSVLITLCLAYGIYTQVEIIRLFVQRWHAQNISSNSEGAAE
jgi:hypothetical protein